MGMDANGNYTLTDPTGALETIRIPASDAKSKIRIARKAAFQPGVGKPKTTPGDAGKTPGKKPKPY